MPTREEIAAWLREAAKLTRDSKYEEIFEQRAAQVEAMRCGSCRKERTVLEKQGETFSYRCQWIGCGGCFHHEPKPAG